MNIFINAIIILFLGFSCSHNSNFSEREISSNQFHSIGFYSGSFDPPTKAHQTVIEEFIREAKIDKLYIGVNIDGPKDFNLSSEERINLIKLAVKDLNVEIEVFPIDQNKKRVITEELKKRHPHALQSKVIGQDSFKALPSEASSEFKNSRWYIVPRGNESLGEIPSNASILNLDKKYRDVSSSLVRKKIFQGEYVRDLLNPNVHTVILNEKFYSPLIANQSPSLNQDSFRETYTFLMTSLKQILPEISFNEEAPPFKDYQSALRQIEKMIQWIALHSHIPENQLILVKTNAQKILFSKYKINSGSTTNSSCQELIISLQK